MRTDPLAGLRARHWADIQEAVTVAFEAVVAVPSSVAANCVPAPVSTDRAAALGRDITSHK